jgi:nicotinamide mononucleotide transporter
MWDSLIDYILANPIELLGFCFTIVSIWLNTQQNSWGWGVGILGIGCYIYISLSINLLGSFILNIYFLLLSIYGWYWWKFGKKEQHVLSITRCTLREIGFLLALSVILTFVVVGLVQNYQNPTFIQYWDAEATALSMIGQWLLARKKIENWLIWIFVNVQYMFIYYYQNLVVTSLLYCILILLAIKGWLTWKKELAIKPTESA